MCSGGFFSEKSQHSLSLDPPLLPPSLIAVRAVNLKWLAVIKDVHTYEFKESQIVNKET